MFKPNDQVTWGTGAPLAKFLSEEGDMATVALTKDVKTPCGRTFATGLTVKVPVSELRFLF